MCLLCSALPPHHPPDFEGLFRAMDSKPVTIRLLDPPLHEFLPQVRGTGRLGAWGMGHQCLRARVCSIPSSMSGVPDAATSCVPHVLLNP